MSIFPEDNINFITVSLPIGGNCVPVTNPACTYPESDIVDCEGVLNDLDGDDICDEDEVPGCTDASACNFDLDATDDDGSCHSWTNAGCAGIRILMATATAMATSSTQSASAVAIARPTRIRTASATMWTTAWAPMTTAGSATAPALSTTAVARTSRRGLRL